jgi:hypothetical protein
MVLRAIPPAQPNLQKSSLPFLAARRDNAVL